MYRHIFIYYTDYNLSNKMTNLIVQQIHSKKKNVLNM